MSLEKSVIKEAKCNHTTKRINNIGKSIASLLYDFLIIRRNVRIHCTTIIFSSILERNITLEMNIITYLRLWLPRYM